MREVGLGQMTGWERQCIGRFRHIAEADLYGIAVYRNNLEKMLDAQCGAPSALVDRLPKRTSPHLASHPTTLPNPIEH
jgi:hypothetical protein